MSFGLRNVGATYQRVMVTLFHDIMHREVEVYVDDILAKSKKEEGHEKVLQLAKVWKLNLGLIENIGILDDQIQFLQT